MGKTIIPPDRRPAMRRVQIIAFILLAIFGTGIYWIYDATNYGYSLKPDFMLTHGERELREMVHRFDQIKDQYTRNGDREAAEKAAWRFQQQFATKSQNLSSSGAHRRAERLLEELQRFQESVRR